MSYRQAIGLLRRFRFSTKTNFGEIHRPSTINALSIPNPSSMKIFSRSDYEFSTWSKRPGGNALWILICSQAAIFVGMKSYVAFAEEDTSVLGSKNDNEEASSPDFRRIEDGSVISNIHTSKWRVFTDNGRNLSLQGKLEEAERFFLLALEEAREGFGKKDPHVASACNNLGELYRVRKAFSKAEPFYLEAIEILEESFGPEDVRVGAAFHNLGQFYLVQRRLEEARSYYERALKIKRRVLGEGHPDYADTMYHLGTVMFLEGNKRDSESLIQNSIRILEEGGQGESSLCLRRLRYLSQIQLKSDRFAEAESVQRKILHILEVSKGWNSLETVIAAERLALTLQSIGSLKEAKELLQQCLNARKAILPEDHIQIGANMLHMARVAMLNSSQLMKANISEAIVEIDEAKVLLVDSIRITQSFLNGPTRKRRNIKDEHAALLILLQSFISLGLLETSKHELQESREVSITNAEHAYDQCISAFKEAAQSERRGSICDSPDVRAEYLSCLKHRLNLTNESTDGWKKVQELKDEINSIVIDHSRTKTS